MINKNKYPFLIAGLACLAAASTNATVLTGPIVNPANGHSYYLLDQDTWTNSEAEANTLGGHLVTINDAAENQWVFETFGGIVNGNNQELWIGLSDVAAEGQFVWSSDEPVIYTNFSHVTSPDDYDYVFLSAGNIWTESNNSISDNPQVNINGVVEVVPEPTSLSLLGLGGLVALRRRRSS